MKKYTVRVVGMGYYYWNNNKDIDYDKNYYTIINQITDLGGIIDPGKYFNERSYLRVTASKEIIEKIKNLPNIESVN